MRSQISMEFMVLIAVGILSFIVVIVIVGDQVKEMYDDREYIMTRNIAIELQNEFYLAAQVHHGYERTIEVPDDVEGITMEIALNTETAILTVKSARYEHVMNVPHNIKGTLLAGVDNVIANNHSLVLIKPELIG
ncbi:MAG: hypothetical protein KJ709_00465 [Nanoarchaeota archaeon]|nr:hypothetical protein [Nanoarchaeota archaeon]